MLVTEMEHHSNLVPWQLICQRTGAKIQAAKITTVSADSLLWPDRAAEILGFPAGNPFQDFVGVALVGMSIIAILALWLRGCYLVGPALVWMTWVHVKPPADSAQSTSTSCSTFSWPTVWSPCRWSERWSRAADPSDVSLYRGPETELLRQVDRVWAR